MAAASPRPRAAIGVRVENLSSAARYGPRAYHSWAAHDLRLHALPTGRWRLPGTPARRLGYLIVDGLIARRVAVARRHRAELLGPGDRSLAVAAR
jgi:hypothetical protein